MDSTEYNTSVKCKRIERPRIISGSLYVCMYVCIPTDYRSMCPICTRLIEYRSPCQKIKCKFRRFCAEPALEWLCYARLLCNSFFDIFWTYRTELSQIRSSPRRSRPHPPSLALNANTTAYPWSCRLICHMWILMTDFILLIYLNNFACFAKLTHEAPKFGALGVANPSPTERASWCSVCMCTSGIDTSWRFGHIRIERTVVVYPNS